MIILFPVVTRLRKTPASDWSILLMLCSDWFRVPPFDSKKTDWSTLGLGFTGGVFLVMALVIIASTYIMTMSRRVPETQDQMREALNG